MIIIIVFYTRAVRRRLGLSAKPRELVRDKRI